MAGSFREAIGSGEVGPTSRGASASAGWVMGYFTSTSDTSGICGFHILLGQGRRDTAASHRKQRRVKFVGYIPASIWYNIYTRTSATLCARPITAMAKGGRGMLPCIYVHRVPNAQCGRVSTPLAVPGSRKIPLYHIPPSKWGPLWRGNEQRAQLCGGARLSISPHVLSASLVRSPEGWER